MLQDSTGGRCTQGANVLDIGNKDIKHDDRWHHIARARCASMQAAASKVLRCTSVLSKKLERKGLKASMLSCVP